MQNNEKRFEQDIESSLIEHGYQKRTSATYDATRSIFIDDLVNFVKHTQPKEWARYEKYYGDDAKNKLYTRFEKEVSQNGLIYVLRNGIFDMGVKISLCFFKPVSGLNNTSERLYDSNIFTCTRQFAYSENNNNTIDLVLSLNGIPIIALELKNQLKNQNVENAMNQFKNDRNSKELCFRPNHRFLAYFAVDLYDVFMTTQLKNENTRFLPFNRGSNGPGVSGGAGNPANSNGYATSYLWEEVLAKDSLLDIIHKFISSVEIKDLDTSKINTQIIFPRYHQYDCVNKVLQDVKIKGSGQNYLIEHSAGSGKSNTIAWIAYRLASIHNQADEPIFSSIIVVTDRIVLDSQLQDTINSFEHTIGLVEAIDDKKRSKGLIEAINDRKRIIICTIQKFLYAYKEFSSMEKRNFAIIIDEAHQGQSGESARTLRKALIDQGVAIKEYAKEEGVNPAEVDIDNEIISDLVAQGRHKNQSFFAFTATPKNKTLEIFGRKNSKGQYTPFHVYSMRQAIEEGFILDVLKNFVHIKESFKIIKTTKENPELIQGQATNALVRFYKEHGHTIDQKVDLIMANFLDNCFFKINGKGKAMIVSDSRQNAVRYYFSIKKYIKDHPEKCLNVDALVAFSGMVKFNNNPKEYTEANMNQDEEGKFINSDKKLRQAFRSDKFKILIVANKYQTGFDEPLLHTMYVDKKLKGVNATQTLSRLNRTYHSKTDTFILDFVNTNDEIKEAFQPFYEMTYLENNSDFNIVYDLRTKIRKYRIFNDQNIKSFIDLMSANTDKKQDSVALGKVTSLFKPITDVYSELDEEERLKFRNAVKKFNQTYSFITQLVRLNDKELFSEFLFTSYLINLLPKNPKENINIDDKIQLQYATLKEEFNGSIKLESKDTGFKPPTVEPNTKKTKAKDTLQSIIDKVNERYDGNFSGADKLVVESIFKMFMEDPEIKKLKKFAKDNNPEMFLNNLFPDKFNQLVSKCYFENNKAYEKLTTDEIFLKQLMEVMGKELYRLLRNKED
jgi:type I restriction enzyme R subunit